METFFESLAKFFLRINGWIKTSLSNLLFAASSQVAPVFFTVTVLLMTLFLILVWKRSDLLSGILFSVIYLGIVLFLMSAAYLNFRKREPASFQQNPKTDLDTASLWELAGVRSIILNQKEMERIFADFEKIHVQGNLESFRALLNLEHINGEQRLIWKDPNPNHPNKTNRQTLLEFLSHLFMGFENLPNKTIVSMCDRYFTLADSSKLRSKNISDWRLNRSPYLRGISDLIQRSING